MPITQYLRNLNLAVTFWDVVLYRGPFIFSHCILRDEVYVEVIQDRFIPLASPLLLSLVYSQARNFTNKPIT